MNTEALIGIQERIIANGDLPTHLAIIMDGNGRWAQNKGLPRVAGHKEGVVSVREITRACGELGIDVLTLYTFSSDNWKRPRSEVNALMRLLVSTIRAEVRELMDNNVRLTAIGRLDDLPEIAQQEFHSAMEQTAANNGLNLNLALSYGGRQEILTAIRRLLKAGLAGNLTPEQVTEELFSDYLYTAGLPDPDLCRNTAKQFLGLAIRLLRADHHRCHVARFPPAGTLPYHRALSTAGTSFWPDQRTGSFNS